MTTPTRQRKHPAACVRRMLQALLWSAALLLPAAPVAADPGVEVPVQALQEDFRPLEKEFGTVDMSVLTFTAGGMNGIALADSGNLLHYIFLQPQKSASGGREFKAEAERLHHYVASLADEPERVRLAHFSGTSSAAAIVFTSDDHRSTFPRAVLGDNTLHVIDMALQCGATFENLENGELTLVMPSKEAPAEFCAIILSLHKGKVDLLGFSPPASSGKKEASAVNSVVGNLHLNRSVVDAKAAPDELRAFCARVGAARCFTMGAEHAIVLYNKKLYVGSQTALKRYIKDRKKDKTAGGYLGAFSFPAVTRPIPEPKGSTPATPDSPEPSDEPDDTPTPADETPAEVTPPPAPATPAAPGKAVTPNAKAVEDYLRYLDGQK